MKPLPAHLTDMTQAKWDRLTAAERDRLRDTSELHPQLRPYLGRKVRVTPEREYGPSTFTVGQTTGWRPATLAVRGNTSGSSDLIRKDEVFETVTPVTR